MTLLEKDIEKKVCDYAREKGFLAYKFTSPMRAAVPDRLFIVPGGTVFFIEFKRPGAAPTPAQVREHARLIVMGVKVYVIDNVSDGKELVDSYARTCGL
jgi:hypothetical protein